MGILLISTHVVGIKNRGSEKCGTRKRKKVGIVKDEVAGDGVAPPSSYPFRGKIED